MFTDEARFGDKSDTDAGRDRHTTEVARSSSANTSICTARSLQGRHLRLFDHAIEYGEFQVFLDVLARRFVRQDILLVLDGAPTIAPATSSFLTTSRFSIFRPIHRNSIRKKISGMKSGKRSSRTMRSNP